MLLYQRPWFFQILEGEQEARDFGEWTMGRADLSLQELRGIPGLNDFFSKGTAWTELDPGRAKSLLEAFRSGQWRASLSTPGYCPPRSGMISLRKTAVFFGNACCDRRWTRCQASQMFATSTPASRKYTAPKAMNTA